MTDNPYSAPVSDPNRQRVQGDAAGSWESITEPLRDVIGYKRFLGLTLIVIGVLHCLTILGALIGWLPIWLGILLLKSANNLTDGTAESTHEGMAQLAKCIRISGVSAAAFLALMLAYIVVVIGVMLMSN